ncbi:SurA N-terminal domain-containing protein [Streptomyces sp. NBC_01218]|uniref:SurA N-terminal domain-containing protein n=1 Tax=unclassified Streptomyces TaxID=2593676 RepID=UPI0023B96998|nr:MULTISPECIES: SurA N-terminal domain-containing protein [unclassified Streptomyces]WEH40148.1 SurA N-terminal domain-containing protein [Streptomyces sp. AM 2-1-1]WSQ51840.1 SurA N-terminal domain-containing protein [Streptomyces sp. NBC_01218]
MHRRRRTALTLSAALLLAAPVLTACGSEAHPGAAAIVGGQRIEVSTLQADVAEVRSAQQNSPQAAQLVKGSGQLPRAALHRLIFGRVLDRAAEDNGVTVSRKELQQVHRAAVAQYGGEDELRETLLQERWISPGQIDGDLRQEVQLPKLAAALGADLQTEAGTQKVTAALAEASKSLHIDVNPRYGAWDDRQVRLGTYESPWLAKPPGTEDAAAGQVETDPAG